MAHRTSGKIKLRHHFPGGLSMSQYHHFTMFERERILFFFALKTNRFVLLLRN